MLHLQLIISSLHLPYMKDEMIALFCKERKRSLDMFYDLSKASGKTRIQTQG